MEKHNILFLDIDGVCNHCDYGEDLYYDHFENIEIPICQDNIDNLKSILDSDKTIKIVWSTDWRLYDKKIWNNWANPRHWLESQDWMKDRIFDKTPKRMSSTHPEEIRMWIKANKQKINNYVILDDWESNSMLNWFGYHFLQCNPNTGLTADLAAKAVEIFKTQLDHLKFNYN